MMQAVIVSGLKTLHQNAIRLLSARLGQPPGHSERCPVSDHRFPDGSLNEAPYGVWLGREGGIKPFPFVPGSCLVDLEHHAYLHCCVEYLLPYRPKMSLSDPSTLINTPAPIRNWTARGCWAVIWAKSLARRFQVIWPWRVLKPDL